MMKRFIIVVCRCPKAPVRQTEPSSHTEEGNTEIDKVLRFLASKTEVHERTINPELFMTTPPNSGMSSPVRMHFGRDGTPYRYAVEDLAYSPWQPGLNAPPFKTSDTDRKDDKFVPSIKLPKHRRFKPFALEPIAEHTSNASTNKRIAANRFSPLEKIEIDEEPNNEAREKMKQAFLSKGPKTKNANRHHRRRQPSGAKKPVAAPELIKSVSRRGSPYIPNGGRTSVSPVQHAMKTSAGTEPPIDTLMRLMDELDGRVIRAHINSVERESTIKDHCWVVFAIRLDGCKILARSPR
jgi:hypothetical protein